MQNQTTVAPLSAAQKSELDARTYAKLQLDTQRIAVEKQRDADLDAKRVQMATLQSEMNSINDAAAAQIGDIEAQKSAIDAAPLPDEAPDATRAQMDEMFAAMMSQTTDIALRIEFRDAKRKLLDAWDAGDMDAVIFILENQAVPPQFESFKAGALTLLRGEDEA